MPRPKIHDERGEPLTVRLPIETEAAILTEALATNRSRNAVVRGVLEREFRPSHVAMRSPMIRRGA